MNKVQKRRLTYVIFFLVGLGAAASLIFYALNQNLNAFVTPSQLAERNINKDYQIRLGGMVKKGSIKRNPDSLQVEFIVTDLKKDITVTYNGILPDLFHEEKGVIAQGKMNAHGTFAASQILAKHDENYMPKNVYQEMRKNNA
jgi:cytochrome c-type biogenesis protein CcmE